MLDVKEGQFVVVQSYGDFRTIRADRVTDKVVRMNTHHTFRQYDQYKRDQIAFAHDTRDGAKAVEDRLNEARKAHRQEGWKIEKAYDEEVAPARARADKLLADADAEYEKLKQLIVEKGA